MPVDGPAVDVAGRHELDRATALRGEGPGARPTRPEARLKDLRGEPGDPQGAVDVQEGDGEAVEGGPEVRRGAGEDGPASLVGLNLEPGGAGRHDEEGLGARGVVGASAAAGRVVDEGRGLDGHGADGGM